MAVSATLHCLTGCAIGEILGMVIGTALGFSDLGTIALAVTLAFLFGYSLTSLPLLRAGLALGAVVPIALASDTASIAVMEIVDNGIMLLVPGAMEAGLGDVLFWGALSVALVVAGAFAFPLNRWLIARGRGHAAVHETGIHGGPSPRLIGAIAVVAAVFGTVVLIGEFVSEDEGMGHGEVAAERQAGGHGGSAAKSGTTDGGHGDAAAGDHADTAAADPVRGLTASADGLTFELATTQLTPGERGELRFQIVGEDHRPVRDIMVEHEKRLHLILTRRDLTGFRHLHPRMAADGTWTTPVTIAEPGEYRVFADFKHDGENHTLARDLTVTGAADLEPLPSPADTMVTAGGYRVELTAGRVTVREPAELGFRVTRDGENVALQDYLGAKGHLVALRAGDLAYLHTHPEDAGRPGTVNFETEFPSDGRYRLFLEFKHDGQVHTAAFTVASAEKR
ncbi:MAG TPA: DUF4396 domain-containing protein [Thermoleophilaceae bacterium]|nr:DUF4396 domain-containing protein [Thermoleophilaceae bacterium]